MTVAVLVIDMQMEMARRSASGRDRSAPGAEERIAELLARARAAAVPIVHVHHDDPDPDAAIRLDRDGGRPMPCAAPMEGEAVVVKRGSSGFAETELDPLLRAAGVTRLVVAGAVLGFCVSSTVRDAVARGFAVDLVTDATIAFDLPDGTGGRLSAATVAAVETAILSADFARCVTAGAVLL